MNDKPDTSDMEKELLAQANLQDRPRKTMGSVADRKTMGSVADQLKGMAAALDELDRNLVAMEAEFVDRIEALRKMLLGAVQ